MEGTYMQFEKEIYSIEIKNIVNRILNSVLIDRVYRICEQYDENQEDCREYDVYRIITASGNYVLKKASEREVLNYERYLIQEDFKVPKYYGKWSDGQNIWIVIEEIKGNDLRDMTDKLAKEAAHSIAKIQNSYWNNADTDRFDVYLTRIEKRYEFIKDVPDIGKAYKLFLEHQKTCPRTLSNGDFLEFNVVDNDGQVYIIDWGFGGIMPYSLDLARFIAHATEDRATFPFYMTDKHKELFLNEVFECLKEKPDFEQYLFDVKLAILNEYVEYIEADEDDDNWYYNHAKILARELL